MIQFAFMAMEWIYNYKLRGDREKDEKVLIRIFYGIIDRIQIFNFSSLIWTSVKTFFKAHTQAILSLPKKT